MQFPSLQILKSPLYKKVTFSGVWQGQRNEGRKRPGVKTKPGCSEKSEYGLGSQSESRQ